MVDLLKFISFTLFITKLKMVELFHKLYAFYLHLIKCVD
ncbi:unnamed protein product, partial [Brassica rapa subsp. narinosa]